MTGLHFRFRHLQVEVRVLVVVAGRVLATGHHHLVIAQFLRLVGDDISLALRGHGMADITLLGLDVIRDLVRLVFVFSVVKDWLARPFVIQTVIHAPRIDLAAVDVHADVVGRQVHRLIAQLAFAVQERVSALRHHHRVIGLVAHRRLEVFLCTNLRPAYTVLYAFGTIPRRIRRLILMIMPVVIV